MFARGGYWLLRKKKLRIRSKVLVLLFYLRDPAFSLA